MPTLRALGRLTPAATMPAAEAEVSALLIGVGGVASGVPPPTGAEVNPRANADEIGAARLVVMGVLAVIGLVLLLACANASNLLLAGAEARRREFGVRLSLGASRARIWRQLGTESLLLLAVSGAAGFLLARWLSPMLATFMGMEGADVDPDGRVVAFAAMATAMSAVGAVLAGVGSFARQDPRDGLVTWVATLFGALYLGLVAVLPYLLFSLTGGANEAPFGGTAVLIIVGVGLETVKQIESQLMLRNYEGFLR